MANLGFLSEEQKKNIWGLPQNQAYIDTSVEADIPQNFAEVDDQPQLLSDIASAGLDPNLKQWSDQSFQIYQNAIKAYSRYGNKGARVIQWYENQAAKYANDYQSQYDNAMQSAVSDVLQKAKPKNTAEAYAALSSVLPDPDDYKKYASPFMEMMGIGKETGQRQMYQGGDGFKYWADTNERVNPDIQKAGSNTISDPLRKTREQLALEQKVTDAAPGSDEEKAAQRELDLYKQNLRPDSAGPGGVKTPTTGPLVDVMYIQQRRKDLDKLKVTLGENNPQVLLEEKNLAELEQRLDQERWLTGGSGQKWVAQVSSFNNNTRILDDMMIQLSSPGVTMGALAGGVGFFEGVVDQVNQTIDLAEVTIKGQPAQAKDLINQNLYDFQNAAGQTAAFKSNIIDLAYTLARLYDDNGRLSDQDVQLQLNKITAGGFSKSSMLSVLVQIDGRLRDKIQTSLDARMKAGEPVEDFQTPARGRLKISTRQYPDGVVYNVLTAKKPGTDEDIVFYRWASE